MSKTVDAARTLSPAAAMDAVTLHVGDLELMSDYYSQALALAPAEEATRGRQVHRVLGRAGVPMLRLIHTPGLPPGSSREAGLFHTAFLFETPSALAATVQRAATDPRSQFVGSSDHLVSEAFYFTDPEGNGIELYRDRPRDQWTRRNGELEMDNLALHPGEYLQQHLEPQDASALRAAGSVGHVHLQVGDVERARDFYVGALGFEATVSSYPGALFAAAGGYHHHVAMNTWNSRGAGPRAARLGLGDVAITVPLREDLDALAGRLRRHGIAHDDDGRRISTRDPWGTQITVALPGATVDELLAR